MENMVKADQAAVELGVSWTVLIAVLFELKYIDSACMPIAKGASSEDGDLYISYSMFEEIKYNLNTKGKKSLKQVAKQLGVSKKKVLKLMLIAPVKVGKYSHPDDKFKLSFIDILVLNAVYYETI